MFLHFTNETETQIIVHFKVHLHHHLLALTVWYWYTKN